EIGLVGGVGHLELVAPDDVAVDGEHALVVHRLVEEHVLAALLADAALARARLEIAEVALPLEAGLAVVGEDRAAAAGDRAGALARAGVAEAGDDLAVLDRVRRGRARRAAVGALLGEGRGARAGDLELELLLAVLVGVGRGRAVDEPRGLEADRAAVAGPRALPRLGARGHVPRGPRSAVGGGWRGLRGLVAALGLV